MREGGGFGASWGGSMLAGGSGGVQVQLSGGAR
jgi:hypothetical protein